MPDPYPPASHVLRDLRLEMLREGDDTGAGGAARPLRVRMPVVPELLDERGVLRVGALGIAADVFGGNLSIEAARPDWAVTSELHLHLLRPVRKGPVEVTGEVLRAGRTSVVLDVAVADGEDGVAAVGGMSFTKIRRRDDNPEVQIRRDDAASFALPDSRLREPLLEAIGLREVTEDAIELDLVPYVMNSVAALQGGLVTTLVEVTAEKVARAALGPTAATTDFSIHYLSLGNRGPIRARARVLRRDADAALLRVELRDRGQQDRLLSVATARAGERSG